MAKSFEKALQDSTKRCLGEISAVRDEIRGVKDDLNAKVSSLGSDMEKLKENHKEFNNRTVRAAANIARDEEEWYQCRRTVMISQIPYEEDETSNSLSLKVKDFFANKMLIPEDELAEMGKFKATRPLSRHKREDAPVQVVFENLNDRDFCFSRMRVLNEKKGKDGRIFSKFPRFLSSRRQHLEAEAAQIRKDGQYWAQVRFSDDDDLITIFVKDATSGGPWMHKDLVFGKPKESKSGGFA